MTGTRPGPPTEPDGGRDDGHETSGDGADVNDDRTAHLARALATPGDRTTAARELAAIARVTPDRVADTVPALLDAVADQRGRALPDESSLVAVGQTLGAVARVDADCRRTVHTLAGANPYADRRAGARALAVLARSDSAMLTATVDVLAERLSDDPGIRADAAAALLALARERPLAVVSVTDALADATAVEGSETRFRAAVALGYLARADPSRIQDHRSRLVALFCARKPVLQAGGALGLAWLAVARDEPTDPQLLADARAVVDAERYGRTVVRETATALRLLDAVDREWLVARLPLTLVSAVEAACERAREKGSER